LSEEVLFNLTGREELSPDDLMLFRTPLSPKTQGRLSSEFFSPYIERLDLGESQPVGSLERLRSLKNYIQEVLKAYPES